MPKFISSKTKQAVVASYRKGESMAAVGRSHDVAVSSVRQILRDAGIEIDSSRRHREYSDEMVQQLCVDYRNGMRSPALAKKYGLRDAPAAYALLKRGGEETRRGHGSKVPDGATRATQDGYISVKVPADWPWHPGTVGSGGGGRWRLQHRVVMSDALQRVLLSSEQVHHINGDRADNRLANLELRSGGHGAGVKLCCNACGSQDIQAVRLN